MSRRGQATVILCYHRVAHHRERDAFKLTVAPEHFAEHLRRIRRRAEIVPLSAALEPGHYPRVVITFDDGYADNLTEALPIATEFGAPMTVFVTSGLVDSRFGFWWDRLARLVRSAPDREAKLEITSGDPPIPVSLNGAASRDGVIQHLHERLATLEPGAIDATLKGLAVQLEVEELPADAPVLHSEELRRLAESPLVTIGAHTIDHPRLSGRSFDAQYETIYGSRAALEQSLGIPVTAFAYPFGTAGSFDAASIEATERAGFKYAVTTIPGSVHPDDHPLRLRRRMVMDWGDRRFGGQLLRWGVL